VPSGPRASRTSQPLGLVQPGSDDRRHRRLGTLLVIDDHYVSLVQGGSRFRYELLDLAGLIDPLLPAPADIP
jgi:hypothetical protein